MANHLCKDPFLMGQTHLPETTIIIQLMMKLRGSIILCRNLLKIWLQTWTSFQDQPHQKLIFMATRVSRQQLVEREINCLKKEAKGKKELWPLVETKQGFLEEEQDTWKLHRAHIIFKIHQTQIKRLHTRTCQATVHKEIISRIKVQSIAIIWCHKIYKVSNQSKSLTVWSHLVAHLYQLEESKVLIRDTTDLLWQMHLMYTEDKCLTEQCIRAKQDLSEDLWIWQLSIDKAWLPPGHTCSVEITLHTQLKSRIIIMARKQQVFSLPQIIATVSIQQLFRLEQLKESQIFDLVVVQAQAQTSFLWKMESFNLQINHQFCKFDGLMIWH